MSFCTFCLEDGGDEGCKTVDNPEVLRFLCQEFQIDFDKTFRIGLEDGEDPLECSKVDPGIPLCSDCVEQFGQLGRIQVVLEDVKGQLDKLLTIVRSNVIVSTRGKEGQMGQEVIDLGVSRKCEILRTEIILSAVGKRNLTSEEVRREEHCQTDAEDFIDVKLEETEEVQIKVEGDDYMEEDVETFNNQSSESTPAIISLWVVQPNASLVNTILPSASTSGEKKPSEPKSTVKLVKRIKERRRSSPNGRKIKCELCTTTETICTRMPTLIVHVEEFHKSAEMKYSCSKPNCDKKFPVEVFLKRHLKFHDEQVTKPDDAFNCTECKKRIRGRKGYQKHLEQHKNNQVRSERAVRCRFCKMASIYPFNVRNHEVTKHPDKLLHSCDTCNGKYSSASILETHVQSHATEGPYACVICQVTCQKGSELEDHLIQSHVPVTKSIVRKNYSFSNTTCPTCERYFTTTAELRMHFRKAHDTKKFGCELCPGTTVFRASKLLGHYLKDHDTGEKILSCSQCPMRFTTNFMLNRHTQCHNDAKKPLWCDICWTRFALDNQAGLQKHMMYVHDKVRRRRNHPCTGMDCDKSFQSLFFLRKHELMCHPEVFKFSCKLCENLYSREVHLETHMKTHANEDTGPFGCTVCSTQQFSTVKSLADHLTKHTGEVNKFLCTKCPAKFYDEHDFRLHMVRQHGAKKPFKCEVCGKRFASRTNFSTHKKLHADPATLPLRGPTTCKECGQQFLTAALRIAHIRKQHRPSLARVCEICGKAVKSIVNHMRMHAGDKRHICYFCDKRFVRYEALKFHLFTHTGEKPFICVICYADFNQAHCLKNHMNNIHKKNGTYFPKPNSNLRQNVNLESTASPISTEYVSTGMEASSSVYCNVGSLDFDALMN